MPHALPHPFTPACADQIQKKSGLENRFFRPLQRGALACAVLALSGTALAQSGAQTSSIPAAPALDVPYVPTPQKVVDRMLQIAQVKSTDYVIDVGCGDGRIVVTAAKTYGARGLCNDIDPARVAEAKENARQAGVTDKVEVRQGDLHQVDISKADVLPMYLLETLNQRLRPKILAETKPGTRVVSHAFSMGDWKPDQKEEVDGRTIYYWIVPARVDGQWKVQQGPGKSDIAMTIKQQYQEFTGQATMDGKPVRVRDGRIRGNEISFALETGSGPAQIYRGRVNGQSIEPVGQKQAWMAKRM